MARKSAAALAIVPTTGPGELPAPPVDLTPAQSELWDDIVASKPADWFGPDNLPILKEYVRAVTMCDVLERQVREGMEEGDDDLVKRRLDMRDKESRRAVSLATKMRLTQQAKYGARDADRADKRAGGKRPWQS